MNLEDDHDLLIQLNAKVDSIVEGLKQLPTIESRVRNLETDNARSQTEVKNHNEQIKNWSLGNTIGVIIATILSLLIK